MGKKSIHLDTPLKKLVCSVRASYTNMLQHQQLMNIGQLQLSYKLFHEEQSKFTYVV